MKLKQIIKIFLLFFPFFGYLSAQSSRHVEAGRVIVKLKPDAEQDFETKLCNHGEIRNRSYLTQQLTKFRSWINKERDLFFTDNYCQASTLL